MPTSTVGHPTTPSNALCSRLTRPPQASVSLAVSLHQPSLGPTPPPDLATPSFFRFPAPCRSVLTLGEAPSPGPTPFPGFIPSHLAAPRPFLLTWSPLSSALPPGPAALGRLTLGSPALASVPLAQAAELTPPSPAHPQPLPHLVVSRPLQGRALATLAPQGHAVHGAVLGLFAPVLQRRLHVEAGSGQCPRLGPRPLRLAHFPE